MKFIQLNKIIICLALCLFIFIPALRAQSIAPDIEKKLNEIGESMAKATLAGDHKILLKNFTDDVVVMPDFKPAIKGIKELTKQYEEDKKMGAKYHSFTGNVEKRWQHGDEIFERGTFGMAVSTKASKHPQAYYGSYFQIWERQSDGSFKISFTIWNLDFNPFETD